MTAQNTSNSTAPSPAPRVAVIHALAASMAPAAAAFAEIWPEARVINLLDDSLSEDVTADGPSPGLSIPPKYAVSQVVGFIEGKSAIHIARVYSERKRNDVGQHFWARG